MARILILSKINAFIQRIESALPRLFGGPFPQDGFCLAAIECPKIEQKTYNKPFSIKDLIGDGILWAVPKHRTTIEKKLKKKYGQLGQNYKLLYPRTHLKVCNTCGGDYEVGILCPTCYKKVREETEAMQHKIQEELKLDPVDKEVIVLYDREKENQNEEFWKGKRIVEMQKPRPMWFSKNLIEKTTQQPAQSLEVKPDKLG